MRAMNAGNSDSLTNLFFSLDPLSRYQHEKVHGVSSHSAVDRALRDLMLAVLQDGIACFQSHFLQPSRVNEKLFQEAEEWIRSEGDGLFSFNSICETLGLDAGRVRVGLLRWKAQQLGNPAAERKRILLSKGKCAKRKNRAA